jgi:hypothetical protein
MLNTVHLFVLVHNPIASSNPAGSLPSPSNGKHTKHWIPEPLTAPNTVLKEIWSAADAIPWQKLALRLGLMLSYLISGTIYLP